ncbi:MAG: hydroxyacylglutathione hydrolase [Alphaproteobacteria bacterium]
MKIEIIPTLKDNYTYILHGAEQTAVIDAGEVQPVIDYLERNNLKLDMIINTHHHGDHVAGNHELREKYSCPVAAPEKEAQKIGGVDILLSENSDFEICGKKAQIIETPGHTLGHICLYFAQSKALFCADTLFSMGCGRVFEGTHEQMWNSLQKLSSLPDDTYIYCGHEYTLANAEFCLQVEPDNIALKQRYEEIKHLRASNKPTIPSTLKQEKETNVFLRAENVERFAEIRTQKDNS